MELTRKQKSYGVVLAIALAVLALDRLTGAGGPREASALAATAAPTLDLTELDDPVRDRAAAPPAALLAAKLRGLPQAPAAADTLGDAEDNAFVVPTAWLPQKEPAPKAKATPAPRDNRIDVFRSSQSLSAVLWSDRRRVAIVNGRSLVVGDKHDGAVLRAIAPRSATFTIGTRKVVLPLHTDADPHE